MMEKKRVEISIDEFYQAIRLFVHEENGIIMPSDKKNVDLFVDQNKLIFEWKTI